LRIPWTSARKLRLELEKERVASAALAAERVALLQQRDIALGERNELLRQRDIALGERNEFLRQRDVAIVERDRLLAERATDIRPDLERSSQNSIFIATLPKSGTEFVCGGIGDATGLARPSAAPEYVSAMLSGHFNRADVISTGVFTSERLVLSGLSRLAPNGFVWASHCMATYHNLCTLRDAGFRRVTVLLRDPRDATVSWTYHIRTLAPSMRNFGSLIQHLPVDYFDWSHNAQLAFQIRTFLPAAVNWIEGWAGAAADQSEVAIEFVWFDAIGTEPLTAFQRIFEFHAVTEYDLAKIRPPEPGKRHFRNGESGTWREEFSDSDKKLANDLIGDRIERAFARRKGREDRLRPD
jgi:hypothetical protein